MLWMLQMYTKMHEKCLFNMWNDDVEESTIIQNQIEMKNANHHHQFKHRIILCCRQI